MIKRLLKNKFIIIGLLLLDTAMIILGFSIFSNKIIFSIILFLSHLIILSILFYKTLQIPLLNIEKWKNKNNIKKIKNKLESEEIYMKTLEINTFDGSGSLTHPSVLYFEDKWNGYHYWMAYTPYDNNNVELENPCIVASNNGIDWVLPNGCKNPLLKIIKKKKPYTFYNDPFLLFTDRLELWYRYTIEGKQLINEVYRITSKDGSHWSKPEKMIENDGSCYMSLSIVQKGQKYYLYYFDMDYQFNVRSSNDLIHWSEESVLQVENYKKKFWHGEVRWVNNHFELLFLDKEYGLYLANSKDGIIFKDCVLLNINYVPKEYFYKEQVVYKSSILHVKDMIYLYIPVRICKLNFFRLKRVFHKKWRLTLIRIRDKNLKKIKK